MSYCRWSSNNWDCDLYCYQDVAGGYTTHVAENRVVGPIPQMPKYATVGFDAWFMAYKAQMDWLKTAKHEHIGLPHDGQTFNDPTAAALLERVLALCDIGYHVPDAAIEFIREDIVEVSSEA